MESLLAFHTINPDKISTYVKREAGKKLLIMVLVFSVLAALMFWLTLKAPGVRTIIFLPLLGMYSVITIITYFVSSRQMSDHIKAVEFSVDKSGMSVMLRRNELDAVTKASLGLNEIRFGSKFEQTILIHDISSTTVSKTEIVFKSVNENLFNGNGVIRIPKEIEGYREIVSLIQQNKELFKLADTGT